MVRQVYTCFKWFCTAGSLQKKSYSSVNNDALVVRKLEKLVFRRPMTHSVEFKLFRNPFMENDGVAERAMMVRVAELLSVNTNN